MAILPRRPQHESVLDIPTPPLQAAAIFIIFFFNAIALLTVALRTYSRTKTRQWALDDWLMSFAMIFSLLMVGPLYMRTLPSSARPVFPKKFADIKLNYYGWRAVDVPEFDPSPGFWWFFVAQLFYNPILALVKASILVFLLRLGGHRRAIRYCIYALNTFNALQAVAVFLVALLQCLPIAANWDFALKAAPGTKCVDNSFHIAISFITVVTDILVVALPFWIFLGLKMPRAAKIAVIGIFLMGLTVTVVSIVRLVTLYKLFYVVDPKKDPYYDITITLNVVEVTVAIISASAPALRPLFRTWMPAIFGASTGKNKYDNTPGSKGPYFNGGNSVVAVGGSKVAGKEGTVHETARRGSIYQLSAMGGAKKGRMEVRGASPTGSEEEIMTYNGIMRTTDVQVQFDGASTIAAEDSLGRGSAEVVGKGR
ncbi:hypothetical protein OQA88_10540 [Cercophora sp. LCS_1]